jgi:hypothetical protein
MIKFSARNTLSAGLRKAAKDFHERMRTAVEAEAQLVLAEAKRRCPVNTGALLDSGRVEMHEEGDRIYAKIVFGDDEVTYALFVHEDLEAHHPEGKQAHFLSSVIREAASGFAQRVAARLKQE